MCVRHFSTLILAAVLGAALWQTVSPQPVQAQSAATGGRFLAVTGPFMDGVSLLYVIDQETARLAVYQGHGGGANAREVVLVGVRNIGFDVQLNAFNDESEYSYQDLLKQFNRQAATK